MLKIREYDIEKFVREYVTALKELIRGHYLDIKDIPYEAGFPLEFPVRVRVYQSNRGFHFYFNKSMNFSFEMVNSLIKNARWSFFIHAIRFEKIKDKGYQLAKYDVNYLYLLPEMIEAHEKQEQERAEYDYYQHAKYELEHYIGLLKESYKIIEITKNVYICELYDLYETIVNYSSRMDFYLETGCETCFKVFSVVLSEIESSLFSALHGNYYSAMAVLRKIFEIMCRSIYFDTHIKNDASYEEEKEKWFEGEKPNIIFTTMINRTINNEENEKISKILVDGGLLTDTDFKDKLKALYKELSKYVHFRTKEDLLNVPLFFSEYDKEKMETYLKYIKDVLIMTDFLFIIKQPTIIQKINHGQYAYILYDNFEKLKQRLIAEFYQ